MDPSIDPEPGRIPTRTRIWSRIRMDSDRTARHLIGVETRGAR